MVFEDTSSLYLNRCVLMALPPPLKRYVSWCKFLDSDSHSLYFLVFLTLSSNTNLLSTSSLVRFLLYPDLGPPRKPRTTLKKETGLPETVHQQSFLSTNLETKSLKKATSHLLPSLSSFRLTCFLQ